MENSLIIPASLIAISILGAGASIAAGIGDGLVSGRAIESMARQPEMASDLRTNMFICIGLIESLPIIAIVIAFVLLFANPFV